MIVGQKNGWLDKQNPINSIKIKDFAYVYVSMQHNKSDRW